MTEGTKTSSMAILAFIFAFIFPIIGLIFGIIAISQIKKDANMGGKRLATVAIVISIILIILLPLLVLFLIGSMAYFGVLNPNRLLPERCSFEIGFDCKDYVVSADRNQIILSFSNGKGRGIILSEATATPQQGNPVVGDCSIQNLNLEVGNGQSATLILNCQNIDGNLVNADKMHRWDINIKYKFEDLESEMNANGELMAKITS